MDFASVDHVLTTTRSVRKRLDLTRPVEPEVIERCLEIAMQAPTGSNRQGWHFIVITDPTLRAGVAEAYRKSFASYRGAATFADLPPATTPVQESSNYLAEHFQDVPALVLFCYEGRVEQAGIEAQAALYGSIIPAAWSFMLALRARGLGSAWTTLHLRHADEVAALLKLPPTLTQATLIPVAYFTGDDFKPAKREPLRSVVHWNGWKREKES